MVIVIIIMIYFINQLRFDFLNDYCILIDIGRIFNIFIYFMVLFNFYFMVFILNFILFRYGYVFLISQRVVR